MRPAGLASRDQIKAAARLDSGLDNVVAKGDQLRVKLSALAVNASEVTRRLLASDAKLAQVHVATRQLALIERIQRNILQLVEGGQVALGAADSAGRAAVLLGDVNNALLIGNRRLNIERIGNTQARSYLELVGRDFRAVALDMEALFASAAKLRAPPDIAGPTLAQVSQLAPLVASLSRVHRETQRRRLLTWQMVWGIAAASVTAWMLFGLMLWRDGVRVARVEQIRVERLRDAFTKQHTLRADIQAHEERYERETQAMAAIVWRLADGDFSVSVGDERLDAYFCRAVDALAKRMESGLGGVVVAAAKMNSATSLLSEAASGLEAVNGDAVRGLRDARTVGEVLTDGVRMLAAEARDLGESGRSGAESFGRGTALIEDLNQHLRASSTAMEEVSRAIGGVMEASAGIRELATSADELSDQARMLSLNLSLQSGSATDGLAAEHSAEELARLAERAIGLGRLADSVRSAIEVDVNAALTASRRAHHRLEGADGRASRALEAVDAVIGRSRETQGVIDRFALACREQQSELRRHVHTLAELTERAEQARSGSSRVSAASTRLVELSGALQQQTDELLSRPREGGTVVHIGAASAPQSDRGSPPGDPGQDQATGSARNAPEVVPGFAATTGGQFEEVSLDAARVGRDELT